MILAFKVRSAASRKGFTLIELLVVMAIVGILAGMLFPAISMIKKSGRKAQCANNLRQLGMGIIQYAQANNSTIPGSDGVTSWDQIIVNYESPTTYKLGSMVYPALRCPEDTRAMPSTVSIGSSVFGPRSYIITERLTNSANGFLKRGLVPANPPNSSRPYLLVEAAVPSATILLTELWTDSSGNSTSNIQGDYSTSIATGYTSSIPTHPDKSKGYYHGSSINFLMADGRLQALNPKLVATSTPAANTDPHWKVIR